MTTASLSALEPRFRRLFEAAHEGIPKIEPDARRIRLVVPPSETGAGNRFRIGPTPPPRVEPEPAVKTFSC